MNSTKAAIAHDQNLVTRPGRCGNAAHHLLQPIENLGLMTQRGKCLGRVPAQIVGIAPNLIGLLQALGQQGLHAAQFHGIGARFQHGQDARAPGKRRLQAATQTFDSDGNGGRMMGKIIINRDPPHCAAHFKTPFDALKFRQCFKGDLRENADMLRCGNGCQCVRAIVCAWQGKLRLAQTLSILNHPETLCTRDELGLPAAAIRLIEIRKRRPATSRHDTLQSLRPAIGDHQAIVRECADKMVKLRFDRGKISEDVCMIELKIIEDKGARMVMNEFRTLIAKGRVVFVGFDDEEIRFAQPRRNPETLRHPADQETGLEPRLIQYPGQHRSGRRLAVGSRNGQHPLATQDVFRQPLRAGNIGQITGKDFFQQGVATRNGIAHHKKIGLQGDLLCPVAFGQRDPFLFELGTHRRVDIGIAARHAVSGRPGKQGDAAHECAADAEDMDMHEEKNTLCRMAKIIAAGGAPPFFMPRNNRHARHTHALPATRSAETLRRDVAAMAARLMAEDGIEDYGLAKRKAARQLGATGNEALPTNLEIEEALRDYQSLYQEEEVEERLRILRRAALNLMHLLTPFLPHLTGPVLSGCPVRGAQVNIDLYADSAKDVEIFLLDRNIDFDPADHFRESGHAHHLPETRLRVYGEETDFLLSVYPHLMMRTQRRDPHTGQTDPRLDIEGLARLLADEASS